MEVRIMGICPLYDNYDPTTGDFRGEVPVFWVYFPSLRQTLVNSTAYNPWYPFELGSGICFTFIRQLHL